MKIFFVSAAAIAALVAPAFAQGAADLVCAEYAAMDDGGKMEILAELESINSESASSQELTSQEIQEALTANCADSPDMMVIDVIKQ